jgi:hypothetical protein
VRWDVSNLVKNVRDDRIRAREIAEPIAMDLDPSKPIAGEFRIRPRVRKEYPGPSAMASIAD